VPDRFIVGHLEIMDVQHLAGTGRFCKTPKQTGVIAPDRAPPHNFSREAIEQAINAEGSALGGCRKKHIKPEPLDCDR